MVVFSRALLRRTARSLSHTHTHATTNNPHSKPPTDKAAAQRKMDMDLGWFADPLFLGDYPETVKKTIGADLPALSDADKKRIKGSLDFLGINYYTGKWVVANGTELGYNITDVLPAPELPGGQKFIGPLAESFWLRVVPWSFRKLLVYVDERYNSPEIMITENGVSVPKENDLTKEGELMRFGGGCLLRFFLFCVFFSAAGQHDSSRATTAKNTTPTTPIQQRPSTTPSASSTTRATWARCAKPWPRECASPPISRGASWTTLSGRKGT